MRQVLPDPHAHRGEGLGVGGGDGERRTGDFVLRNQMVRELLFGGVATSLDISDELGISRRHAQVSLRILREHGHVEIAGRMGGTSGISTGQPLIIWKLTAKGMVRRNYDNRRNHA